MIGIDLGTTNTTAAYVDPTGEPVLVARPIPSVVAFVKDEVLVGDDAKRHAVADPRATIRGVKRLLGRRLHDPEVRRAATDLPFLLSAAPNGDVWVDVAGRVHSPEAISAHLLAAVRRVAEERVPGAGVAEAVIVVPAAFDHAQRQATRDAAEIAGLHARRLISEPVAAALGAGLHRRPSTRAAVCHLGGGTFEVALVDVEQGVIEVVAADFDPTLGGDEIDRRIAATLAAEIREQHGIDVRADGAAHARLLEEVEKLKHSLSEVAKATIQIPTLTLPQRGETQGWLRVVGRLELEAWTAELVERLDRPARRLLARGPSSRRGIDELILTGGMTRMPAVQRRLAQVFGREPAPVDPEAVVALGAAVECAILSGRLEGVVSRDVVPRTVGLHVGGGRVAAVVRRFSPLPARESRVVQTTAAGQREIAIEVYEGEDETVGRNRHLGTFVVGGLPEAPAGEVLVRIDFTVDVDGLIHLGACEMASGSRPEIRIVTCAGLTRGQVRTLAAAQSATLRRA